MKLLLDENVSGGLAQPLRELGFEVLVVGSDFPSGIDDDTVFRTLLQEKAVLVTRDYHFTNPVRFDAQKTQGIIYIHHGNLTSPQEIALVTDFLRKHAPEEYRGRLVTLYLNSIRIR